MSRESGWNVLEYNFFERQNVAKMLQLRKFMLIPAIMLLYFVQAF